MSEKDEADKEIDQIRKLIEEQIDIIHNAVIGEGAEELAKTARKIFANLPADEFTDDKKKINYKQLYFTVNNDVGLMLKYGDNIYWMQGDRVVRVKITKAGTTHEAFKKGKLIASDILPPSMSN